MSTQISGKELAVVNGTASPDTTAQTPGMIRNPGIDNNTAGAKKIWLGKVECVPNTMGPPHHHGEAETAAYIIKGHIRVYYGEDYKEYIEGGPGDFLYVPANFNHCLLYTSPSPRDATLSRMPSSG